MVLNLSYFLKEANHYLFSKSIAEHNCKSVIQGYANKDREERK